MTEMTSAGIGTRRNSPDPLTVEHEEQLWSSGTVGFHSSKALSYAVFYYNCKVFGFRAMNEHVNLIAEQYGFGADKEDDLIIFNARISKNVEGGLHKRKVDIKTVKQYRHPSNCRCVVAVFREYMRCIPSSGISYRKLLSSREARNVRYGAQAAEIDVRGSEVYQSLWQGYLCNAVI